MYELIQVAENSYYIESPAKIGIVRTADDSVCLIDSGSDKDAGRKVRQILDANKWKLQAIYITHSNADHIGGCKYLQAQTDCSIFAPGLECDFTNHPILEPAFLYGGYPFKDLRHKFLMAQESFAQPLTADVLPQNLESISLPGHFFDMVGFRTADDVVFLADAISSRETIEKYKIGFIYDVSAYLETLQNIKNMSAKLFIPSHAEAAEDISELSQFNIDTVYEIADKISDICRTPLNFERIHQKLFDEYDLKMSFQQYVLVGSTLRSYLSWLKDSGRISAFFENNMLLWQTM